MSTADLNARDRADESPAGVQDTVPGAVAGAVADAVADAVGRVIELRPASGGVLTPQDDAADDHDDDHADHEDDHEDGGGGGRLVDGVVVSHPGGPDSGGVEAESLRGGGGRVSSRPVLPVWVTDREAGRAAVCWAVRYAGHVTAFHVVRAPVYWGRLAGRCPAGAWRVAVGAGRWVMDAETRTTRQALGSLTAVGHREADSLLRLTEQRRRTFRLRLAGVAGAAGCSVAAAAVGVVSAPAPGVLAAALAGVAVLGWVGRRPDRPVTSRMVSGSVAPRLTSDLIVSALAAIGHGELNKNLRAAGRGGADGVRFVAPITRDGGGWRADLDLPPGVTAGDVAERRDRLASGLRRPVGCVWPTGDPDVHEGRLTLWVADVAPSKTKPKPWPLAEKGTVDLFGPFPLGTDPRGNTITITLMFASMVIGAMPRMGKTFTLRLILLAAALDPRTELHVYDLKGGADLMPLGQVAHRFRIGDDADDIAYLLADLRELVADMTTRYKTLRGLGRDVCPEGKTTPTLADRRDLALHPVLIALDECQRAFEHPDHGTEIAALVEDLVKRGPAVGIIAIPATQRPDARSLPPGISANAALRFCLKVNGQLENDMVLGTSSYKAGVRATMFSRSDRGMGYLAGEGDDPVIVRTAYLDADAAERIAARARTARTAANRLTGHAAGIDTTPQDEDVESILDHLNAIWPPGQSAAWCETLAERLATTYPAAYDRWTGEQVTNALKPHGLTTRQLKRTHDGVQTNRRGITRDDLTTAITHRDGDTPRDHP